MKTTYENTIISTGISQIELRTVPTIPTGEDGYEPMRFSTNRTDSPPQTLKEHGVISWKLAVLIVVIALAVSVISSLITGAIVYGKAKTYQDELSEITNTNINDLDRRLNYTLMEKQLLENQLNGSNWDPWSNWGSCTVECGGGLRSRSRQCNENVCVGNNQEVELCNSDKCTGSNWDPWSNWGSCTVECGGGLRSRSRQCNENVCVGNNQEVELCNGDKCTDGGWSLWSGWSTCSVTCGGGIRSRDRSCNNLLPSSLGHYCPGQPYEVNACSITRCADPIVFFSVHSPTRAFANGVPLFSNVIANVGGGYDTATGRFTCSIVGMYHFSVTFMAHYNGSVYCYIRHNSLNIVWAYTFGTGNIYQSATASTYLSLAMGDTVDLGGCGGWNNVYAGQASMFTGALITPS